MQALFNYTKTIPNYIFLAAIYLTIWHREMANRNTLEKTAFSIMSKISQLPNYSDKENSWMDKNYWIRQKFIAFIK